MLNNKAAIRPFFHRHVILFIMLAYGIIFLLVKNPGDPYDRLIVSDGKAYYAYLPALFIYQDLEYGFIEYYESKYYPSDIVPGYFKEFRFEFRGQIVNKAFAGIAVLMLPFFLIAHLLALLFAEADAYSIIYQYAIGFSAYFYLGLGLLVMRNLLACFSEGKALLSLILVAIALGTNLVYYTVVEGTMAHVYLFFLVNLFLLFAYRAIHEKQGFLFLGAAVVFGLILITRPQNGFIIFALPFLAGTHKKFSEAVSFLLRKKRLLLKVITSLAAVVMLQVVLWYAQTGYLLVYSYGHETFNFLKPQLANLLWSYEKGWMVYTPLAFLSLIGLIKLLRDNPYRAIFLFISFFILAYVFSCWWVWHYTSQFGQRVFIDFYGLLAILLLLGYSLFQNRIYKLFYKVAIIFFVLLNLFQFYQHIHWVYPAGPLTAQTYWKNFIRTRTQAAVLIPEEQVTQRFRFSFPVDASENQTKENKTTRHLKTHRLLPYKGSKLFSLTYGDYPNLNNMILKVNTEIWACSNSALNLQFDFFSNGKKYSEHMFGIDRFLRCERANPIEAAVFLPLAFNPNDSVRVSLTSPSNVEVKAGNSFAELIKLVPDANLRWITRPLNSVISRSSFCYGMNDNSGYFIHSQQSDEVVLKGKFSSKIDASHPFGLGFKAPASKLFKGLNRAVRISAATFSEYDTGSARLVVSVLGQNKTLFYKALPLDLEAGDASWKYHDKRVEIPYFPDQEQEVNIYFWDENPPRPWYVDSLRIDFLTLADRSIPPKSENFKPGKKYEAMIFLPDTVIVDRQQPFYGPEAIALIDYSNCLHDTIIIRVAVKPDCWFSSSSLVLAHYSDNNLIRYQSKNFIALTRKDQWSTNFYEFFVQPCISETDILRIYIWNPANNEHLKVADFSVYIDAN